jgi:hypothetical protein
MAANETKSVLSAAWLKPMPKGYKIPLWRWIFLPALTVMLKRDGGSWVMGEVTATADTLSFGQTAKTKTKSGPGEAWELNFAEISEVTLKGGMAQDRITITHSEGTKTLIAIKAADFVAQLQNRIRQERFYVAK